MQTILGAGGAIGVELAKVLPEYSEQIRLVSRNPRKVNPSDRLYSADLTDREETLAAIDGSDIVYLTVGLPYDIKIWREKWPPIMQNVIEACQIHGAKLVFFDNIYMYDGSNLNPITEDHPHNPPSKKGEVREQIVRMLWEAVEQKKILALIARSADFYGPGIKDTSVLNEAVIKPLSQGKTANWLGNPDCKHAFTYTLDAARATALLGNTPEAYGQVWHLPTAPDPPTGREWIRMIAEELNVRAKYRSAGKFMVKLLGLFNPVMREIAEMMYQNTQDYVFNSDKFMAKFDFEVTPYQKGVREVVEKDYGKVKSEK